MKKLLLCLLLLTPTFTCAVTELTVAEIVVRTAEKYKINPQLALNIARCESSLNPKAYSKDGGAQARGVWQITRKWHPEVSDAVAFSAASSTDWAMQQFKKGRWHEWTCYRIVRKY